MDTDQRRFRFAFSLRALLVAVGFIVLAVSHFYTSLELSNVRSENILLRQEVERFPLEDERRLHAAALLSPDSLTWRWRLYVPSDGKFVLRVEHKNLPESGFPTPAGWVGDELPAGEVLVTVTVHQDADRNWWLVTMAPTVRHRFKILPANAGWLGPPDYGHWQEGTKGVTVFSPGERALLLRARQSLNVPGGKTVNMKPTDGVMVWVEEQ